MRNLDLGIAVIHLDVAQARLARWVRRRRGGLIGIGGAALLVLLALALHPWLAQGSIVIAVTDPATEVLVDGVPAPRVGDLRVWRGPAGMREVTAQAPGMYPDRRTVLVTAGMTTTTVMPPGRPRPDLLQAPLPAPGAVWRMVTADGEGWRAEAQLAAAAAADAPLRALMRVTSYAATRLNHIDRYPAADDLQRPDGRRWLATWEPDRADQRGERGRLTLTLPDGRVEAVTTEAPIDGLWWSPDGAWLVLAVREGNGSVIRVWEVGSEESPLHAPAATTLPGRALALEWAPDGAAAVVFGARDAALPPTGGRGGAARRQDADRTEREAYDALLLVLPRHGRGVQTATLPPGPARPGGLAPLGWGGDGLFWAAQYADRLMLTYWAFDGGAPTTLGALPDATLALQSADPQRMTLVVQQADGRIGIQTWPGGVMLVTLDDLPAAAPGQAGARWRGWTLALLLDGALWHATCDPALLAPVAGDER